MAEDIQGGGLRITTNTGVSIALVVTIVGGIASNLLAMSSLRERLAAFEVKLEALSANVQEMKAGVVSAGTSSQIDLHELRTQILQVRDRLTKLEVGQK